MGISTATHTDRGSVIMAGQTRKENVWVRTSVFLFDFRLSLPGGGIFSLLILCLLTVTYNMGLLSLG